MRDCIKDIKAVDGHWLKTILINRGFQALLFYRISHWMVRYHIPLIPLILTRIIQILYGIDIDPRAKIAGGCKIYHGVGLVIGPGVVIGEGTILFHGVTLGVAFTNRLEDGYPELGENVWVFAGAKILGGIKVGNNARVGANAVVLNDVPAGSTAVGIPSKILQKRRLASINLIRKV